MTGIVDPVAAGVVELPVSVMGGTAPRRAGEGLALKTDNRAPATRRAYAGDFAHFASWCTTVDSPSLPAGPETVCLYLTALVAHDNAAGYSVATLQRRLAAITYVHEVSGYGASPARHLKVRELMAGIRRTYRRTPAKRDPLTIGQLAAMVASMDLDTLAAKRDRAILLVGYAGAFRRAELAGLTVSQVVRRSEGYVVRVGRTDTDQVAEGRRVGIPAFAAAPLCPVAALDAWLSASGIDEGPLFRKVTRYQTITGDALSPASVALIVKRTAAAAGIPTQRLAGDSLRAGHAITAATNGAPGRAIMAQTGHRSADTLVAYIRPADILVESSARFLDLEAQ